MSYTYLGLLIPTIEFYKILVFHPLLEPPFFRSNIHGLLTGLCFQLAIYEVEHTTDNVKKLSSHIVVQKVVQKEKATSVTALFLN
jgi:hypothetical protein